MGARPVPDSRAWRFSADYWQGRGSLRHEWDPDPVDGGKDGTEETPSPVCPAPDNARNFSERCCAAARTHADLGVVVRRSRAVQFSAGGEAKVAGNETTASLPGKSADVTGASGVATQTTATTTLGVRMRIVGVLAVVVLGGCSTTACVGDGVRVGQQLLPRLEDGTYRTVVDLRGRAAPCEEPEPVLAVVANRRGDVVDWRFWVP